MIAALAASAAATAIATGSTAIRWWDRAPGAGLSTLSDDEYAFVQALAEAWMPGGGIPALSGRDADLGAFTDAMLETMSPTNRKLLKLLLQILDDSTLPTHLSRFTDLRTHKRQQVLRGWLKHDIAPARSAVQGLMVLISVGWTTHPDVVEVLRPSMRCAYGR